MAMKAESVGRGVLKMTLFKLVRHRIDFKHVIFFKQVRNRSITGHVPTDVALKTITGGRVDRWLQSYEDFVGLTEVKQAQTNVIQVHTICDCARQFLYNLINCFMVTEFTVNFYK